jgi:hypothetical protein
MTNLRNVVFSRLFRDTVTFRIVVQIGNLGFHFVAVKFLDEAGADQFVLLYTLAVLLSVLPDFGFRHSILARLGRAQNPSELASTVGAMYEYWRVAVVITIMLFIATATGLTQGRIDMISIVLFAVFAGMFYRGDIGLHLLMGSRQAPIVLRLLVGQTIILFAGLLILIATNSVSIFYLGIVCVTASIVRAVLVHKAVSSHVVDRLPLVATHWRKDLLPYFDFWSAMVTLGMVLQARFPVFAAEFAGGSGSVAALGLGLMVIQKGDFLAGIFAQGTLPQASAMERPRRLNLYVKITLLLGVLGLLIAGLLSQVLPAAIAAVTSAGQMEIKAVGLAAWAFPLIAMSQYLRFVLSGENRSGVSAIALLAALIVGPGGVALAIIFDTQLGADSIVKIYLLSVAILFIGNFLAAVTFGIRK